MQHLKKHEIQENQIKSELADIEARARVLKQQADFAADYNDTDKMMFEFMALMASEILIKLKNAVRHVESLSSMADPDQLEDLPF